MLERQTHVILVLQHVTTGTGHACRYGDSFFSVVGEVQLCINSRVDRLSRPEGCDLNFEGLEPFHESELACGCTTFE